MLDSYIGNCQQLILVMLWIAYHHFTFNYVCSNQGLIYIKHTKRVFAFSNEIVGFFKILLGDAIEMKLLIDILSCDIYPNLAKKKKIKHMWILCILIYYIQIWILILKIDLKIAILFYLHT